MFDLNDRVMPNMNIPASSQNFSFGLAPKLSQLNDRESVNIRNMNRFAIVQPRGFGAVQMEILTRGWYKAMVHD